MIRRHDRYVYKAFWANFLAVVAFLTIVVLVFDLSDRLARVNRHWDAIVARGNDPVYVVLRYYATLIPFLWMRLLPFSVPLAAAFALSRLNRHNELTPLLTTGVSMRRVVRPIVLSGLIVVGGMLLFREYLVPKLSWDHMKAGLILRRYEPSLIVNVPHFHDPGGARISMDAFRPIDLKCEGVTLTHWADDGTPLLIERYPELAWDAPRERWVAPSGGVRIPLDEPGGALRQLPIDAGAVAPIEAHVSLIQISLMSSRSAGMSFSETRQLLQANPDNARLKMIYHGLYTGPLSTLVLLLGVLPFCAYSGRRGSISAMLGSLGMVALYFGSSYLLASLGGAGELQPALLAWLPTAVFGSLGLALYLGME